MPDSKQIIPDSVKFSGRIPITDCKIQKCSIFSFQTFCLNLFLRKKVYLLVWDYCAQFSQLQTFPGGKGKVGGELETLLERVKKKFHLNLTFQVSSSVGGPVLDPDPFKLLRLSFLVN